MSEPNQAVTAYKLFREKHGKLYPLFIGKNESVPVGCWLPARRRPTPGFADRPGWHAGALPLAPQLRTRQKRRAADRVWAKVQLPADINWQPVADKQRTHDLRQRIPVNGHYRLQYNKRPGGDWLIGGALKVLGVLSDHELAEILTAAGHADQVWHETRKV